MKFLHLADLHIGKTVNGFAMLEDQRHILQQIEGLCRAHTPNAILIAGDVYDKPVPSAAAVSLFDDFLTALAALGIAVMVISGNHDSPERLNFASRIMQQKNIYMCGLFEGSVQCVELADTYGTVAFHLLPFIRPAAVRRFYPETEINSYHTALQAVLSQMPPFTHARNVLAAHQFVTAAGQTPLRADSETEPVGGLNNVDSSLFDSYDYVALGHLHGPQQMGRAEVRYAGSPLKYSFSEHRHNKSVPLVTLNEKGSVDIRLLPLTPLRDMRKINGPFAALTSPEISGQANAEDYLHVTLTDDDEIIDAIGKLRRVYPNVMELHFDNARTRAENSPHLQTMPENKTPFALFGEFFQQQNGMPLTEKQQEIVRRILEKN